MREVGFKWDQRRRLIKQIESNRLQNIRLGWDSFRGLVVASYDVTPGTVHIATVPTGAMFFHLTDGVHEGTINFAPFAAGVNGMRAPYLLAFYDSSNLLVGAGYAGAVGGGEADGGDILAGWDLTSGFTATNATINDANTFTTSLNYGRVNRALTLVVGALYKGSLVSSETAGATALSDAGAVTWEIADGAGYKYKTVGSTTFRVQNSISGVVVDITSMDLFRLTDIPNTGLKLYSTKNGATQSLMITGTGNVNAIKKVTVLYCGDTN